MYFLHTINSDRQTRLLNVLGQIAMILGDKRSVLTKDCQVSTDQWCWHFRVVPSVDHIIKSTVLSSLWKQRCSFPNNNFYNYLGIHFWYCINISHYGKLFSSSKVLPSRLPIATPETRLSRRWQRFLSFHNLQTEMFQLKKHPVVLAYVFGLLRISFYTTIKGDVLDAKRIYYAQKKCNKIFSSCKKIWITNEPVLLQRPLLEMR